MSKLDSGHLFLMSECWLFLTFGMWFFIHMLQFKETRLVAAIGITLLTLLAIPLSLRSLSSLKMLFPHVF